MQYTAWAKGIVAVAGLGLLLLGCGRTMTPAELAQAGTHPYAGRSRAQVFRAATLALRTEGYEIVSADEGSGRIKTAAKTIGAQAVAVSRSYAVATETSFGWSIDVTAKGNGAVLHAEPRGYQGSQLYEPTQMNADWLDRAFATLYKDVDANLPASSAPRETTTTSAPVAPGAGKKKDAAPVSAAPF